MAVRRLAITRSPRLFLLVCVAIILLLVFNLRHRASMPYTTPGALIGASRPPLDTDWPLAHRKPQARFRGSVSLPNTPFVV